MFEKVTAYRNRTIDPTKKVKVYKNLHKNTFSIQQNGKVVGHSHFIVLKNCKFVVNEAGRKRVLEKKQKNVHAFVVGHLVHKNSHHNGFSELNQAFVSYNPYAFDKFYLRGMHNVWSEFIPINHAEVVRLEIAQEKTTIKAFYRSN
jgi:hypothetical protein